MTTRYAVICAPGYGNHADNKLPVYSSHATAASAIKAAGSDKSVTIVRSDERKGSWIWADTFGRHETAPR